MGVFCRPHLLVCGIKTVCLFTDLKQIRQAYGEGRGGGGVGGGGGGGGGGGVGVGVVVLGWVWVVYFAPATSQQGIGPDGNSFFFFSKENVN